MTQHCNMRLQWHPDTRFSSGGIGNDESEFDSVGVSNFAGVRVGVDKILPASRVRTRGDGGKKDTVGWDVAEWVIGTCRGAMIAEKRTLHESTREVTQCRRDEPCGFEIACFAYIWLGASDFDLFQIILLSWQTTESIIPILARTKCRHFPIVLWPHLQHIQ